MTRNLEWFDADIEPWDAKDFAVFDIAVWQLDPKKPAMKPVLVQVELTQVLVMRLEVMPVDRRCVGAT